MATKGWMTVDSLLLLPIHRSYHDMPPSTTPDASLTDIHDAKRSNTGAALVQWGRASRRPFVMTGDTGAGNTVDGLDSFDAPFVPVSVPSPSPSAR